MAPPFDILVRSIERLGQHRLLYYPVVTRLYDVLVHRDGVGRRPLERKSRLEQSPVQIIRSSAGRVTVYFAHPQKDLASE